MRVTSCLLLVCAVTLTGCATTPAPERIAQNPTLDIESDAFGAPPDLDEPAEIFRLSPEQRRAFLRYFYSPERDDVPANRAVYDYLDLVTTNFNFQGKTLAAKEALSLGTGNCLSLAILTTALAELADVEIGYQLMDSTPIFQLEGSTDDPGKLAGDSVADNRVIYKGVHARSILYDPDWRETNSQLTFRRPGIQVDYYPTGGERFIRNLARDQFVSMYYSNLAADAVAEGDLSQAYWLLRKSLELAPQSTSAVNMMAVVFRRAGDDAKAEEIYRYGISNLPEKVSLLRNYRLLLEQQGRQQEANELAAQLLALGDNNPFDWIHAAQQAHREGHYPEAIRLYKKAVAVAPYLHESYFGMARSHFELGNRDTAERQLELARERANRASIRSLYEAKLVALQALENEPRN